MSNIFYVYAYLRKSNNTPYYIGKGKNKRAFYRRGRFASTPKDKSKIVFLETQLTEQEAFKKEKEYIALYGRKNLGTGILLNLTEGGEGPSKMIVSKKTRDKLSSIHKGRIPWNKGISMNLCETSIESKRNKMTGKLNPFYGKKHSKESRKIISEKAKGRISSLKGRKSSLESIEKMKNTKKKNRIAKEIQND